MKPRATQRVDSELQITQLLDDLLDGWCDRRSRGPLRLVLPVWPAAGGWLPVLAALRQVRDELAAQITPDELDAVNLSIAFLERMLSRQPA